ncbi:unnamed protein product [Chrysoparadoxa australica]
MEDAEPSLLALVVDVSGPFWRKRGVEREQSGLSTFQETLEALFIFIESFLLLHRRNDLCFIAATRGRSAMLYPTPQLVAHGKSLSDDTSSAKDVHSCIVQGLSEITRIEKGTGSCAGMAKALTQALCYASKKRGQVPSTQAQVLVLQAEPDQAPHYNGIMNCIFAAQKAQIIVDCCVLRGSSMFLQQAAYLTGGIYTQYQEPHLLQHLLMNFLPSGSVRNYLKLPRQAEVDFQASCFCHRNIVDIAWVCSVCLSVFCEFSPVCSTCGARAPPPNSVKKKRTSKH